MIWALINVFARLKILSKLGSDPAPVFGIKIFEIVSIDNQVRNEFNILWNRPFHSCFIVVFNVFIVFYAIIWLINSLTFSRFFFALVECLISSRNLFLCNIILILILIFIFVIILLFLWYRYIFFFWTWIRFFFHLFHLFDQKNFKHYW